MKVIMGIDPSAKKVAVIGFCPELNTIMARAEVLYRTGTQKPESLALALTVADELADWAEQIAPGGDWYVWIENPLVGRGGVVTTMKQAYVGGILRAVLHDRGFRVGEVNQSTWKRDVIGSGRAEKGTIAQVVRETWPKVWGLVGNDQDLADAAAICLYGRRSLRAAFPDAGSS